MATAFLLLSWIQNYLNHCIAMDAVFEKAMTEPFTAMLCCYHVLPIEIRSVHIPCLVQYLSRSSFNPRSISTSGLVFPCCFSIIACFILSAEIRLMLIFVRGRSWL